MMTIDIKSAIPPVGVYEYDDPQPPRSAADPFAMVYISAPRREAIEAAAAKVMERVEPCPMCSRPLFSARTAIEETDLPEGMSTAAAIRELWARLRAAGDDDDEGKL